MGILLPSVYIGNIEYFQLVNQNTDLHLEVHEFYEKQTFRNRCEIYCANGKLDLVVPIVKGKQQRKPMNEARINNEERWQRLHWRSLESAYRTSPYFEYYEDEIRSFFENEFELLIDLNEQWTNCILKLLQIERTFRKTDSYEPAYGSLTDYRSHFDPRIKPMPEFKLQEYVQVFGNKHGFIGNLSILDLLFNCGPESGRFL